MLVGVANNSLQGINDRIRAKFEKMKHLTREAAKITASQQMSIDGGAEVQSLRDSFQEREQELQQQVEETCLRAEREKKAAQQQIQEVRKEAEVIRLYLICAGN